MMQKWGCGDVDQINVITRKQSVNVLYVRHAEAPRRSECRFAVRSSHADQLYLRKLREMLQRHEPEPACADHPDSHDPCFHISSALKVFNRFARARREKTKFTALAVGATICGDVDQQEHERSD